MTNPNIQTGLSFNTARLQEPALDAGRNAFNTEWNRILENSDPKNPNSERKLYRPELARDLAEKNGLPIDALSVDTQTAILDAAVYQIKRGEMGVRNIATEFTDHSDFYPAEYIKSAELQAFMEIALEGEKPSDRNYSWSDHLFNASQTLGVGMDERRQFAQKIMSVFIDRTMESNPSAPYYPDRIPDLISALGNGQSDDPLIAEATNELTNLRNSNLASSDPEIQRQANYCVPALGRIQGRKEYLAEKEKIK